MFTIMHNLAGRIALLIGRVIGAVAAAEIRARPEAAVPMAFWWRTERLRARLLALYERFQAGRLPAARRRRAPRAGRARPAGARAPRLEALLRLADEPAGEGEAEFLAHPEMLALIEAAPEAAGRILRPLCGLLGVAVPAALALPRRERRAQARKRAVRARVVALRVPAPRRVRAHARPRGVTAAAWPRRDGGRFGVDSKNDGSAARDRRAVFVTVSKL